MVEILIVVAIIIMALGLSSLYLSNFQLGRRVGIEASQLTAMLKAAQEKSIGQENDSRWGVYINNPVSGQGAYALYMVDEGHVGGGIPGTPTELRTMPAGTILTDPTAGATKNIVFERGTGLPTSATTVVLDASVSPTNTITVYVNANGQIEYR